MNPEQDISLVTSYLAGELNPEAKQAFEARLAEDAALQAEVQLQQSMRQVSLVGRRMALEERFQQAIEEDVPRSWFRSPLALAAVIALLLTITSIWYINRPTTYERLFASHFSPPVPPQLRGENSTFYLQGIKAYQTNDFAAAIEALGKHLATDSSYRTTTTFYLAMAHLAEQEADAAIPLLETIASSDNIAFGPQAGFYLGMSYLLKGEEARAREHLEAAVEDASLAGDLRALARELVEGL